MSPAGEAGVDAWVKAAVRRSRPGRANTGEAIARAASPRGFAERPMGERRFGRGAGREDDMPATGAFRRAHLAKERTRFDIA